MNCHLSCNNIILDDLLYTYRYERFNKLKQQNPSLKTLLAVGGWNMGSAPFTRMVATDAGRREFATTSLQFLQKHGFDGLDIDWEYPANRGSPAGDRDRFTQLVKVFQENQFSNSLALFTFTIIDIERFFQNQIIRYDF